MSVLTSEEEQIANELQSLKDQIENLKAAVLALKGDTEKKEVSIAKLAREKEKITLELLKQRRSNIELLEQLEEERSFYFKEKLTYCQEMNEIKKMKKALSGTSAAGNELSSEHYRNELMKVKRTLNQTLEANYNLSIKFLRMKNTKSCLKTQLKTMQLEHEKLVTSYKSKIQNLSDDLNDLINDRLSSTTSGSSKKYLHLVKQNSCLVYENLCLQLEIDNLNLKFEKVRLQRTKSESNSRLRYIEHGRKKNEKFVDEYPKKVRIRDEKPEKLEKDFRPLTSKEVLKIYERNEDVGIPNIHILDELEIRANSRSTIQSIRNNALINNIVNQSHSKLDLFQVSTTIFPTSSTSGRMVRVCSSPELHHLVDCKRIENP
ncbi:uncharacterized protein LOC132703821 isoform X2 [Cylas formicarius]|nr:uncharacterized protein LOC132703821 isoform X2 [Cylas formicarius]